MECLLVQPRISSSRLAKFFRRHWLVEHPEIVSKQTGFSLDIVNREPHG